MIGIRFWFISFNILLIKTLYKTIYYKKNQSKNFNRENQNEFLESFFTHLSRNQLWIKWIDAEKMDSVGIYESDN